jgi:hypothetical protein
MRATGVKRAWVFNPVTCVVSAGLGLTVLRDLPRSCPGHAAVREGSSWRHPLSTLCTVIWNYLIVWLRGGQAAGVVIAARARLRLAMWTVSS